MRKFIVTTTINKPTEATQKFCKKKDWFFIIVGDKKTPEEEYRQLEKNHSNVKYLSHEEQDHLYPELSSMTGWNTIQRRNIGFVHAYRYGADIVATVDDDNIPYEHWGKNVYINQEIVCDYFETSDNVFDPLSVTDTNFLWHRGFPIELLKTKNNVVYKGKRSRRVLIQADLWDGDPDIDAMARLTYKTLVKYNINTPFFSNKISPFNSQNTFLARGVIPFYFVWPSVGRMDDIWSGYHIQTRFKDNLIYAPASVYQERNVQDLITNLEKEIIGYRHTYEFVCNGCSINFHAVPESISRYKDVYEKACLDFL